MGGNLEGGMKCLKMLMFLFNLIFLIAGLVLLIVGVVVQVKFSNYTDVLGEDLSKAPYVTIAVGAIIFIIAFFGCYGAWKEHQCMMMTFATLMTLILILEVVATSLAVVYQDKVRDIVTKGLKDGLKGYESNDVYRKAIDGIQQDLKCCGMSNYTDWRTEVNISIPESCCKSKNNCLPVVLKPVPNIYTDGCVDALGQWCKDHLTYVAGVAGALCVIEVLGILFACCLARAISSAGYAYV